MSVLIPLTDWAHNAHSMSVQRGQNAHYNYVQSVSLVDQCAYLFG